MHINDFSDTQNLLKFFFFAAHVNEFYVIFDFTTAGLKM